MASRSSIPGQRGVIAFFFFFFTFAEQLKSAMENQGLDSIALAEMVGVSVVTVKRWLNGTYEPRHENLPKIARELNVSTDYLHGKES